MRPAHQANRSANIGQLHRSALLGDTNDASAGGSCGHRTHLGHQASPHRCVIAQRARHFRGTDRLLGPTLRKQAPDRRGNLRIIGRLHARPAASQWAQQAQAEPILGIVPAVGDLEPGCGGQFGKARVGVLAAVFDLHRFAFGKRDVLAADPHALCALADQEGFDAAALTDVHRVVTKAVQIEIAPDLAIEPRQQVQGELGGDAGCVVVGRFDQPGVLVQIDTDQGATVAAHGLAHRIQQFDRGSIGEIAERRAGEEHHVPPRRALRIGQAQRFGEVGAHRQHLDLRKLLGQPRGAFQQRRARDFQRRVGHHIAQALQQQFGLAAAAAAVFDHVYASADRLCDRAHAGFQQTQFGTGEVILRLLRNGFEQLRAARIVEIFRRQRLGRLRQPRQCIGGDVVRLRAQVGQRGVRALHGMGGDVQGRSLARRTPANCQRASEEKKLR
ncbi:hypothetical protein XAC2852_120022 [Xanthomonas citri pv. citri]|nr:hypothetical protein XAC2852_120022 [Xanthomonas citri pv. citri]